MDETITRPESDPLGPANQCDDFDEDCADIPGLTADGFARTHLGCWLYDPTKGWCPFLRTIR